MSPFRMSKAKYYADFFIVPMMMGIASATCFALGASWTFLPLAAAGWLGWTAFEYVVHRFVFHGRNRFAREHAKHHRYEAEYIGVTSLGTLAGFSLAGVLLCLLFGLAALPIMFGLMGGYLAYIVVHDRMHHSDIAAGSLIYALKQHHVGHHCGGPGNYGVSTRIWDAAFGTLNEGLMEKKS